MLLGPWERAKTVASQATSGLIERRNHPTDRRAQGLHLSPAGQRLQSEAQATATQLEQTVSHPLKPDGLQTLNPLPRKVYRG